MIDQAFIKERLIPIDMPFNQDKTSSHHTEIEKGDASEQKSLLEYLKATGVKADTPFRQAGVLLPLIWNKNNHNWDLLLTQRAMHLKHHAGEISFPGGRFEECDINLQQTAKRETQEEVGIDINHIEIIGKLPKQNTISQYQVTPFVGVVDPDYNITIDTNEVKEAFIVPLSFVININNHKTVTQRVNKQSFSFTVIQYKHYKIWGATARMIVNFGRRLKR